MNYTTIEQSKRLLELGLNPDTADMLWELHNTETPYVTIKPWTTKGKSIGAYIIPCWSVGALLEVMPKEKELPFEDSNAFVGYGDSCYRCVYLNGNWESLHQEVGNSYIEAAYNMVVWLLENRYIKTEKK